MKDPSVILKRSLIACLILSVIGAIVYFQFDRKYDNVVGQALIGGGILVLVLALINYFVAQKSQKKFFQSSSNLLNKFSTIIPYILLLGYFIFERDKLTGTTKSIMIAIVIVYTIFLIIGFIRKHKK